MTDCPLLSVGRRQARRGVDAVATVHFTNVATTPHHRAHAVGRTRFLSCGFAFTAGLAYSDPGIPITHVTELQSSGSNDDLCIEMGVVFGLVAVLWGVLRIKRRFGGADVAVNAALVAAQIVYLVAIDAGSISQTIARDRNLVLAAWLVTFEALAICVVVVAGTRMNASRADTTAPQ